MTPAASAARSGELNPNTYFVDWKNNVPAGWSVWNPAKGCSVKPRPDESGRSSVVELVPSPEGFVDFSCNTLKAKEVGISAGDSLLIEVELRADADAPLELMLKMLPATSGVDLHLPYTGEGVWRTLRISVTVPAVEVESVDFAVRLRGVKQGTLALVRRVSIMLTSPL